MIFVIMTTLGFGQANLLMEGSILPKEYTETISFEIDQNYIVLPVEIEGKKYRFLFDTGAVNILNSTVFSKFKSINSVKISDTNSKREETNILSVPIFKLGNLTFQDYKFLDYNFSKNYIFNCLNFDGIIGSNSLKDSVIKIDYQNKKLIISNSKDNIQTSAKPEEMKLLGAGKSPFLLIKLSGKDSAKESVLFDSGFRNFYLQSERAYNLIKTKRIYQNQ